MKASAMRTISFTIRKAQEIQAKVAEQLASGFVPSLAFVFATERLGLDKISMAFRDYDFDVFGCSSGGNLLANGEEKVIYEDEAVITLLEVNPDFFAYQIVEQGPLPSLEFGRQLGEWGASKFDKPSFLVAASGLAINGQELVEGVLEITGEDTVMFGGLASDDVRFEKNYVFSGNRLLDSGAIVIAFDTTHISIEGLATSGWVGLGKDLVITSSESNIVYSIDDEPALRVYKTYLSVEDADLPAIGVEYPLLIKRETGDYALRAVMGVDIEKEALIFAGSVPQNSTVTFSSSPGFEVMDRTKDEIEEFYNEHKEADMILLFSCMARHLALGPVITEEISFPAEKWNLPLSGFFTYGEIGNNRNKRCDFFNQTYTLVIIREK